MTVILILIFAVFFGVFFGSGEMATAQPPSFTPSYSSSFVTTETVPETSLFAATMTSREGIRRCIEQCQKRHQVEANVRLTLLLFGDKFTADGIYREQCDVLGGAPPDRRLDRRTTQYRLELSRFKSISSIQPGTAMTATYDDSYVWIAQSLDGKRTVKRVQAEKLIRDYQRHDPTLLTFDMSTMPMLGGLAGFLRQLDRHFFFESQPADLVELGKDTAKFGAYRITGLLREEKLNTLLNQFGVTAQPPPKNGGTETLLPAQLPVEVSILVGLEDWFPYHFEFYTHHRGNRTLLMEVYFESVKYNDMTPFPKSIFMYRLSEREFPEDMTDSYIEMLHDL